NRQGCCAGRWQTGRTASWRLRWHSPQLGWSLRRNSFGNGANAGPGGWAASKRTPAFEADQSPPSGALGSASRLIVTLDHFSVGYPLPVQPLQPPSMLIAFE